MPNLRSIGLVVLWLGCWLLIGFVFARLSVDLRLHENAHALMCHLVGANPADISIAYGADRGGVNCGALSPGRATLVAYAGGLGSGGLLLLLYLVTQRLWRTSLFWYIGGALILLPICAQLTAGLFEGSLRAWYADHMPAVTFIGRLVTLAAAGAHLWYRRQSQAALHPVREAERARHVGHHGE